MDENVHDEALEDVHPDRRAFVKRVAAITAFAAPMIASYDLEALSPSTALAESTASFNQTVSVASSRH